MADVTVTRQDVQLKGATAQYAKFQAGEAITQGQAFYKKTDGKRYLANAGSATEDDVEGIALTPAAAADDYFIGVTKGPMDIGGTLTVGESYFLSDTDGGIMPDADLISTNYVTKLGIATAADTLDVQIHTSSAQVP